MNLLLLRQPSAAGATLGELFSADESFKPTEHLCYTLEDVVRATKVPGETAIPAGRYKVEITYSNRFERPMPQIMDVPGFTGVRIHPGNTAADTEGCILVGVTRGTNSLGQSRMAFEPLFYSLRAACVVGPVWLEIRNAEEGCSGHEEEECCEETRGHEEGRGEGQREAGGAAGVAHGAREGRQGQEVSVTGGQGLGA